MVLVHFFGDPIGNYLEINLNWSPLYSAGGILFIFLLFLVISIVSGFYPAIYLSGIRPLRNLTLTKTGSASLFRKGLVVFQFFVSISLIISTFIVREKLFYKTVFLLKMIRKLILNVSSVQPYPKWI
jgi:putative ABC transport system permease protein